MIQSTPLLTVVIPFLNRKNLLSDTLDSISRQENVKRMTNLVLVDNGSTDGAREVAEEWIKDKRPDWLNVHIVDEKQKGASKARNSGLAHTNTPWVMFFDSDDIMRPQHIATVHQAIDMNPKADLIHWTVTIEGRNSHHIKRAKLQGIEIDIVMHGVWSSERFVVKRKYLKQCGDWNEEVAAWDDWELSLRLFMNNPSYVSLPGMNTVKIIAHDNSISGPNFTHKEGIWEKSLEAGVSAAISNGNNRILFLIIAKAAVLAANYRKEGNMEGADRILKFIKDKAPSVYRYAMISYKWALYFNRGSAILLPFVLNKAARKLSKSS